MFEELKINPLVNIRYVVNFTKKRRKKKRNPNAIKERKKLEQKDAHKPCTSLVIFVFINRLLRTDFRTGAKSRTIV